MDTTETAEKPAPLTLDIAGMVPGLAAKAAAELNKRIEEHVSYKLGELINAEVTKVLTDAVMPTVREQLAAQHAEIVATIVAATKQSAGLLGEAMVARATERLAKGGGDRIVDEIFKSLGRGY